MIVRDALRLVGAGVLAGCVMLLVSVRFVRQMLYGVSEFDPLTWGTAVLVLIAIAVIAAFVPAMRAASVDPMQALRAE
jgi:ABC-type antimicrobial peptide transport system permease subunit